MDKLNINSIPEPFKEFLHKEPDENGAKKPTQPDQREIYAMGSHDDAESNSRNKEMQDLLFLAAILMLCDD